MSIFLVLTFLFFAGSLIGWCIEVLWRRFTGKEKKWINPGFLTGPYLPIYGLSLCLLFSLSFIDVSFIDLPFMKSELVQKTALFVLMALSITAMEYVGGLIFIKGMRIKLWDYSEKWGNVKGLICPEYTFYWYVLSAVYYFLIHPQILEWLYWFTNHLAFCLVIGYFYGVLTLDLCYTFNISAKIKENAKDKIVHYEELKSKLRAHREELKQKHSFIFQFSSRYESLQNSLHSIIDR